MAGLKIIQWNLCSLRAQNNYLKLIISTHSPDIIALQETRLIDNHTISFKNYNFLFKNRATSSGGVALYIKASIPRETINISTNHEVVATRVLCDKKITICNVYFAPNINVTKQDLVHIINQLPQPFILIGDFNAHSILWGNNRNCNLGRIIENIIEENDNIILLNNGDSTHFCLHTGTESAIDLSICSTNIANTTTWSVLNSLYGSDHFPILIEYGDNDDNPTFEQKWKYDLADWSKFVTEIDNNLPNLVEDIDQNTTAITNTLLNAANNSIPKTKPNNLHHSVPWWNIETRNAVKE